MTKYVCKCGRIVNKSTSADNTGNRDTAGCDGCPYLLPWGPFQWDETRHAMVTEIKGYECRMSPTLNYATYYQGSGSGKCVLHIYSLDYDFLERVAAWTAEHFPDKEISCNFSRDRIRAVEFIGGLYRMSVYPVQNKKGIAAKAALLEHFFDGNGARKDMTPDSEKARILAAIEDGKARAQKKETNQMNPIISENLNNGGTYAYYAGRFWVYGKTANEWFVSDLAASEYQKAHEKDESLTPEDFMASSDVFVQLEDWEITTEMVNSLLRAAKAGKPQRACLCASCTCTGCHETCFGHCHDCGNPVHECNSFQTEGEKRILVDSDPLKDRGEEPDSNPTQAAPGSPADAGAAAQSPSDAEAVSLAAESDTEAFDYTGLDEATQDTLHWAEREIGEARRDYIARLAQAVHIAHDALCSAVVQNLDTGKFEKQEENFRLWCESVGIKRSTAYNLLQVNALLSSSTPEEQEVLEAASPSLLYAAAKPSAPDELVQGVKSGDITTHKQYQEALAQLKAAQEARQQAEAERDEARREAETAARKARETEKERDGARDALRAAKARGDKWQEKAEGMSAQLEQMRAAPIDAAGADADRVEELVQARLKELSARREPDGDEDARAHHAYDAFILASRSMDSVWKTLKPLAADLAPGQAGAAGNLLVQKLTEIREDVIHVCENRES